MIICDDVRCIHYINIWWPGSVHDIHIYRNSIISRVPENFFFDEDAYLNSAFMVIAIASWCFSLIWSSIWILFFVIWSNCCWWFFYCICQFGLFDGSGWGWWCILRGSSSSSKSETFMGCFLSCLVGWSSKDEVPSFVIVAPSADAIADDPSPVILPTGAAASLSTFSVTGIPKKKNGPSKFKWSQLLKLLRNTQIASENEDLRNDWSFFAGCWHLNGSTGQLTTSFPLRF